MLATSSGRHRRCGNRLHAPPLREEENTEVLRIQPRSVKEIDGIRPFQKAAIDALRSNAALIVVEAPVGAGKSFILRRVIEDERFHNNPIILTYPTKVLMNAQVNALKRELGNVRHWPDDPHITAGITLFEYSSDALVRYVKSNQELIRLDKSELLNTVLRNHQFHSSRNIIVTTPDVLHLIRKGFYRGSQRIEALLNKALVFFDEFHLYTNLKNFAPLIEWLIDSIADKLVFLSATPTISAELGELLQKHSHEIIDFGASVGGPNDKVFNYPLRLHIDECRYTKKDVLLDRLRRHIPSLAKPLAVIFDSVFRLRHIKPIIEADFGKDVRIMEYSGMRKDEAIFQSNTILLGTSSIEVGVEFPIKSLITEAAYWTSAIQRLGRVGRFENGEAVLLTKKRFGPFIKNRPELSRDDLEENVLKRAMKESMGAMVSGEMFRGDNYPFLVVDKADRTAMPYTEAIFAMFDVDTDFVSNWRDLDQVRKVAILKNDYGLSSDMVEDVLIRDKLFPFWGVVSGKLKTDYESVVGKVENGELTIYLTDTGKSFYFSSGDARP